MSDKLAFALTLLLAGLLTTAAALLFLVHTASAELQRTQRDLAAARRALEARPVLVTSPPPDTQNCLCVLPNDRAYFECRMRLKETP